MELGLLLCIGLLVLLAPHRATATVQVIASNGPRGGWRLTMLFVFILITLLLVANGK
jgi:hypothetical protein